MAEQGQAPGSAELSEHAHREIGLWLAATPPEQRNVQRFLAEVARTHGLAARRGDPGWDVQAAERAFGRVAEQEWWRKLGPEALRAPGQAKGYPLLQAALQPQGYGRGPGPAPKHSMSQVMSAQRAGLLEAAGRRSTAAEEAEQEAHLQRTPWWGGWGDGADADGGRSRTLRVVIEAGHGGGDPGAVHGGVHEADLSLALAQALAAYSGSGITYEVVVRSAEGGLGGLQRDFAEDPPDLVIALHHNAAGPQATGAELYYDPRHGESERLAALIQRQAQQLGGGLASLGRHVRTSTHGAAAGNHYALRHSGLHGSVLVEAGFMTNPGNLARIQTEEFRRQVARELDQAVREWARSGGLLTAERAQGPPDHSPGTSHLPSFGANRWGGSGISPEHGEAQLGERRIRGIFLPLSLLGSSRGR